VERAAGAAASLVAARGAASAPDALRALFELAHRAALFAPPLLLRGPAIEPLLALAVEGIRLREREPCRAAAQLLVALLSPGRQMASWGDAWRAARPALDAVMARCGGSLAAALCAAGAATAHRGTVPSLGGVLYALLNAYPVRLRFACDSRQGVSRAEPSLCIVAKSAAPQWLHDAVAAPDFPAAAAAAAAAVAGGTHGDASAAAAAAGPSPLGDDEKRAFLRAALRSPPLSQARRHCVGMHHTTHRR
jgi:hypothetical protein